MRKPLAALIAVLMLVVAGSATAEAHRARHVFVAVATGSQEVPAVDTGGHGVGVFTIDRDESHIRFMVVVNKLDDVVAAHLHVAPPGENGDIVAWVYPDGPPPTLIPGTFRGVLARGVIAEDDVVPVGAIESLDDLIEAIRSGDVYLNIHTVANPGGEVRGQLR
jgi:hypothetical protein